MQVATITYRLTVSGDTLCHDHVFRPGFTVHTLAQYAPAIRATAAQVFGLDDGPGINVVVPGSPASTAGLKAADRLLSIDGSVLAREPLPKRADIDPTTHAQQRIAAAFADGTATLVVQRGNQKVTITIVAERGCASEVQLVPSSSVNASSDGDYVTIPTALAAFAQSDDELAIAIGHELAHNILHHGEQLDREKVPRGLLRIAPGNARRIRATEEEADRLGLFLVARAGYDMRAASTFWRRYGAQHGSGPFGDGTHPSGRSRADTLDAIAAEIEHMRALGQPLTP